MILGKAEWVQTVPNASRATKRTLSISSEVLIRSAMICTVCRGRNLVGRDETADLMEDAVTLYDESPGATGAIAIEPTLELHTVALPFWTLIFAPSHAVSLGLFSLLSRHAFDLGVPTSQHQFNPAHHHPRADRAKLWPTWISTFPTLSTHRYLPWSIMSRQPQHYRPYWPT